MKNRPIHLTMIDDDSNFLKALSFSLDNDFQISTFSEAQKALSFLQRNVTDAILLDLHMQDIDGFTVCQQIKSLNSQLPVFFLTSDQHVDSISQGLSLGVMDYFNKSIPSPELSARVKSRLSVTKKDHVLSCGVLKIDLDARLLFMRSNEVNLTPKEYDIIKVFMERPDTLITKTDLLDLLWKDVHVDANNIDTHMFHLRNKLKDSSTKIQTKKGLGYILRSSVIKDL